MKKFAILALPLLALAQPVAAFEAEPAQETTMAIDAGAVDVPSLAETENMLLEHVRVLASDEYMGRKPGTEGGRMTVAYQIEKLIEYGYEPGWNGSFEQMVPLMRTGAPKITLTVGDTVIEGDGVLSLSGSQDFDDAALVAIGAVDEIDENVADKIVVIDNPAIIREAAQAAVAAGAKGAILLGGDAMVANFRPGASRERVRIAGDAGTESNPTFLVLGDAEGEAFKAAAADTMSARYESTGTRFESANVIAKLPGSRPEAGAIVMLAHWDHTGECGAPDDEDRICNGAVDNASGVAAMLETARRLAEGPQLERDVYIFGTTAEEMGLLGARYFADNPPRPLAEIHAALNLDTVAIAPENLPMAVVGLNRTPLDDSIKGVAASLGRTVDMSDEAVEVSERFIRRQDGWALMNKGVPTVLVGSGVGVSEAFDTYMSTRYHRANDEIWEGYELGGVASDVPVYVALMQHWATEALYSKPAGWTFDGGADD